MGIQIMKAFCGVAADADQDVAPGLVKEGREALARLVKLAVEGDSGQVRCVVNFLLAWWNAERDGGFDFTHLWNVDNSLARDMMTVTALFTLTQSYADSFGYRQEMETLVHRYSQS